MVACCIGQRDDLGAERVTVAVEWGPTAGSWTNDHIEKLVELPEEFLTFPEKNGESRGSHEG